MVKDSGPPSKAISNMFALCIYNSQPQNINTIGVRILFLIK